MTTNERNAATLALAAPLALPIAEALACLVTVLANAWHSLKADHAARRALAAHRAAMLNPPHTPMTVDVPLASLPVAKIVYDAAAPVLGDDDMVKPKRTRKARQPLVVSVAANSPVDPAPAAAQPNAHADFVLAQFDRLDYAAMSYRQLQAAAKAVGVKANGTKGALIAALLAKAGE